MRLQVDPPCGSSFVKQGTISTGMIRADEGHAVSIRFCCAQALKDILVILVHGAYLESRGRCRDKLPEQVLVLRAGVLTASGYGSRCKWIRMWGLYDCTTSGCRQSYNPPDAAANQATSLHCPIHALSRK